MTAPRRPRGPRRLLLALVGCLLAATVGACAPPAPQVSSAAAAPEDKQTQTQRTEPPYDIRPLLHPDHKYLGVAVNGSPRATAPLTAFTEKAGKRPDLREYYAKWGDPFQPEVNRAVWDNGQLPFLVWEPFSRTVAQIAAGKDDAYIRKFADAVRDYNRPLALSFGHEMNGGWYPWGGRKTKAADFARAWRHIHDLFRDEGAADVIWVWSPNVINPVPDVRLKPYYPGDAYVDWIGVVGYYALSGPTSFRTLFGPTLTEIRRFSRKPFIVAETGVEAGERKPAEITDLFAGVRARDDVLGLVWFNLKKEADWRIDSGPLSLAAFREAAADDSFGFDVRKP
ncbi:glycoside hydrolase family 26 protein [Streptomyces sp. NL15-2K]|uniref:glycoside hydrolase family 26 protein n=1 Tax=Streptomyces sp. NL15-2K TaxID=376149 RepID=UPI000F565C35|nr:MULTISPECIES: glycosyl hydrolase [Actinomycetes]WKX12849.1 glycosyl hydrolase [Kutzneria buriramensis]GCB45844.1 endoglucanase [Streptomyces sp. NL15-2K]